MSTSTRAHRVPSPEVPGSYRSRDIWADADEGSGFNEGRWRLRRATSDESITNSDDGPTLHSDDGPTLHSKASLSTFTSSLKPKVAQTFFHNQYVKVSDRFR